MEKMARHEHISKYVLCFLIVDMDLIAGLLGTELALSMGQNSRLQVFDCPSRNHQASMIGVAAIQLLLLAIVIANPTPNRHYNVWSILQRASTDKQPARSLFLLSCITGVIAFGLLIIGPMANSSSRKSCGVANNHYLLMGVIACFIYRMFAVSYMFLLFVESPRNDDD